MTMTPGCTCGPYWSVIPPGPCPVHAQLCSWWPCSCAAHHTWRPVDITRGVSTTTTGKEIDE